VMRRRAAISSTTASSRAARRGSAETGPLSTHRFVGDGAAAFGLTEEAGQGHFPRGQPCAHSPGAEVGAAIDVQVRMGCGEVPPGVESHARQCPDLHRQ